MPRGRPRKTDPDAALDAAMTVFWERGFDGTSMSDLVGATGMAKPGLYATFGDKEALYRAALDRYITHYGAPVLEHVETSPDPIGEVMERFLAAVVEALTNPAIPKGCFLVNSTVECTGQHASLEEMSRELQERRRRIFVKRFAAAAKNGELPPGANSTALADYFIAQALALAVMARGGADRKALKQVARVAMGALAAPN